MKVSFLGQLVGSKANLAVYTPLFPPPAPLFAHTALLHWRVGNDQLLDLSAPLPRGREPWLPTGTYGEGIWGTYGEASPS